MTDPISGAVTDITDATLGAVTDITDAILGAVNDVTNPVAGEPADMTSAPAGLAYPGEPAISDPAYPGEPAVADPASTFGAAGETGASIYECYDGQAMALQEKSAAEAEQIAAQAGGGGVSDPLSMLVSSGVGWLLGHISFLREPLDALQGDPAAIQAQVDQLMQHATELMTIANDHSQQMTEAQDWSGEAADAFHGSMDRLSGELASLSSLMDSTANITAASGEMLVAVRAAVEELITTLVTQLIIGAAIALAWAAFTFGASLATFIATSVAEAVIVTTMNIAKIQELMSALERQGGRVDQLSGMNEEIATSVGRFDKAAG